MTDVSSGGVTHHDVVCPFCGLGCDDVSLTVRGNAVEAGEGACGRAAALFRRSADPAPSARVMGREVALDEALAAAAELVSAARSPVYGGLGTDVDGVRALIKLASKTGGSVDHYASTGLFRNLSTSQRKGWIATTLAEVRNHCDLLVVIGPDPSEAFHRLYNRITPPTGRFIKGKRKVVFLGGAPSDEARAQLEGVEVETIAVPEGELLDALARLQGLLSDAPAVPGGPDLAALAEGLKGAHYGVLAWSAGMLGGDGDLIVERASIIVDILNVDTRAACLPLAGRDNLIGANQAFLWNIGFPLRTAFRGGQADHDQLLNSTEEALKSGDLLIWTSAFRPEQPPAFEGQLVAFAHPDTIFEREPEVFVPVGQPGLDHRGLAFRTDTVVSIPLGHYRDAGLPSIAMVAKGLRERLS